MLSIQDVQSLQHSSPKCALRAVLRLAGFGSANIKVEIWCRDDSSGYSYMPWTAKGPGRHWTIDDGPRPLDALLEVFPGIDTTVPAKNDPDSFVSPGVASLRLVSLTPCRGGEVAVIAIERHGYF